MRKLQRDELVDYQTWQDDVRPKLEADIHGIKRLRRIHVGDQLTFLFENAETVRWQVQEMMRVERIVKEAAIVHELDTYNELLGNDGELGAVLLIEIDDPEVRAVKLSAWLDMPKHWYVKLEDGTRVGASFDPRQIGETRLSSVQYIKFDTGGATPVAVGCDHPDYVAETVLSDVQRQALEADLAS